ncbi:hypothetical protein B6U83_03510 [Thermoplasmatales archaeon ex4484_36]|nr:MAG: hypothetical protein B6U83_03510 [Thermoplasmatales archaeon ex4484_36]RLF56433.1 MAG: hypothetical protein DRN28_00465 [Thermoplasmata archaeon]RLF74246.1 MAG: hypothetical protein DRN55_00895 [Thermoplasmata archaeon]
MSWDGPVVDTHFHLDIINRGYDAVRRFREAGGTHLVLVHKPLFTPLPSSGEEFQRRFGETLKMAQEVERMLEGVWVVLGIHPVVAVKLRKELGTERAISLLEEGVKALGQAIEEGGGRVVAVGEVGRPHFPVDEATQEVTDHLFGLQTDLARERGLPLVLHTEGWPSKKDIFTLLKGFLEGRDFPASRAVKHFSGGKAVGEALREGFRVSVVAREKDVKRALIESPGGEFMLESDYLDDLQRPDKVIPPDQIPRLVRELFERGTFTQENLQRVMVDLPREVYGLPLD